MRYDFDEIIDRSNTNSLKYEAGSSINPYLPKDYLPLWVADMDFACAPQILDAMRARLDRRILGYSILNDAYRACVADWMHTRHLWNADPDEIVFSNGVVRALNVAAERLTEAGDAILFMTPAYHPFDDAAKRCGRTPLYTRMLIDQSGYHTIDFDDLAKKAARRDCTMLYLCNPHNPSGRAFTKEELQRIGEICFDNGVFVISDEIHCDLLRMGQTHIPFASLFPEQKRLVTCTSPSKTFNLAGNHHANLFVPDERIRAEWTRSHACGEPSPLSIVATEAAYRDAADWLDALRVYLDGNFALIGETLSRELPEAIYAVPEGTYLAWVDLSAYGQSEDDLNRRVSQAGVFVQFGRDFVDNGACCMRINAACPRATLAEGLRRICGALA